MYFVKHSLKYLLLLFMFLLIISTTLKVDTQKTIKKVDDNKDLLLHANNKELIAYADNKITTFYSNLNKEDDKFSKLIQFFLNENIPYTYKLLMGEENCKKNKKCFNVKQNPIYRLDQLDCTTLVETFLAMLQSNSLTQFKKNFNQIAYGALYPVKSSKDITNINKNNFYSSDFLKVNQKSGRIKDVTNTGIFFEKDLTKNISAVITHKSWFYKQKETDLDRILIKNVKNKNIINDFKHIKTNITYIPKEVLTKKINNKYIPNNEIINKIPVPSIVAIVRDPKKWMVDDKPIKDVIGSEILVSHVGILYKQTFLKNDIIYQNISCGTNIFGTKRCKVKPVVCKNSTCKRLMVLMATSAYANNFIYSFNEKQNKYVCTAPNKKIPKGFKKITNCNRVIAIPLGDYLVSKSNNKQLYMDSPAILGVNVQKINNL